MVRKLPFLLSLSLLCPLVAHAVGYGAPVSVARVGLASASTGNSAVGAWNGERFLVAWRSSLRGGQALLLDGAGRRLAETAVALPVSPYYVFPHEGGWTVVGATFNWVRVSADGVLLDQEPRAFTVPFPAAYRIMVWTGSKLVLVMERARLTLVILDGDMELEAIHEIEGGTYMSPTGIASDGETVLLLYVDGTAWYNAKKVWATFDSEGRPLRKSPGITGGNLGVAAISSAGDGSGFLVVMSTGSLHSSGVSLPLFHVDREIRTRALGVVGNPGLMWLLGTLTWDGSAFTFFYGAGADLRALRLSREGLLLEDDIVFTPLPATVSSVRGVGGSGTTAMVYSRADFNDYPPTNLYLHARVGHDAAGFAAAQDFALENSAFMQETPVSVTSATQSLLTWRERMTPLGPLSLMATRVAADGTVLDPGSILVSGTTCDRSRPAVASDGSGFLVAWYESDGVAAARVGADGSAAPRVRLDFRRAPCLEGAPQIASNGTDYLVIWTVPGTGQPQIRAARIRGDGTLIDSVPLELGPSKGTVVAASNGKDYLLAWDNRFVRVSSEGTRIDHSGNRSFPGSSLIAIWWNGASYSVVHEEGWPKWSVTRISNEAAVTPKVVSGEWQAPWPAVSTDWLYRGARACDIRGCSWIGGDVANGRYVLYETRIEDDGTNAAGLRRGGAPVTPVRLASADPGYQSASPLEGAAVRLANGSVFAAYIRRVSESPFAGAQRIYLHPTAEPVRSRAVRH